MRRNVLLVILVSLVLCGCKTNKNIDFSSQYMKEIVSIYDNDVGNISIVLDTEHNKLYEVINNEIVNTKNNVVDVPKSDMLELNKDAIPRNITDNEVIVADTWESDIESSSSYVKYLEEHGYRIIREANTQEFIEVIVTSDINTKRLLITDSTLTISTVEYKELNISNYIR